jgi:hypothetical protein
MSAGPHCRNSARGSHREAAVPCEVVNDGVHNGPGVLDCLFVASIYIYARYVLKKEGIDPGSDGKGRTFEEVTESDEDCALVVCPVARSEWSREYDDEGLERRTIGCHCHCRNSHHSSVRR